MAGMSDGVSRLWILRRNGALDIEGFKDELGIDALIRHALIYKGPEMKQLIEDTVKHALTHLDDEPPASDDGPTPTEAAS